MDYEVFRSRKEAQARIATMAGWQAKPVQIYLPDHPDANRNGNIWVIEVDRGGGKGQPMYLRADGFVR